MARLTQDSPLDLKARTEEFYSGTIVAEIVMCENGPQEARRSTWRFSAVILQINTLMDKGAFLKNMLAKDSRSPS